MAAIQQPFVVFCYFMFSLAVFSLALPVNPFDENEDGLHDWFDRNRDGKPDMVYVLPAPAASYGPGSVMAHFAAAGGIPVAASGPVQSAGVMPLVAYHHAAGVPLYHHIQPAVVAKDQLHTLYNKN